jgi:hypothetical protein
MLAKVDATTEKSLGDKFGVSGYPTLKILRHGKRFDYNGPREADGIPRQFDREHRALQASSNI